jgi:hypothetical protein
MNIPGDCHECQDQANEQLNILCFIDLDCSRDLPDINNILLLIFHFFYPVSSVATTSKEENIVRVNFRACK